jgi:hypothetical protein
MFKKGKNLLMNINRKKQLYKKRSAIKDGAPTYIIAELNQEIQVEHHEEGEKLEVAH